MNSLQPRHTLTLTIWFAYLSFVIYGSLVPLDFRPLQLDQAWAIFQHTPMYQLGVESRADWIANGVLYIPVGFLTAHLLIQAFSGTRRVPLCFLAGMLSAALSLVVEFTQIFFPPRTVSLNDLFAENVGSVIGLVLAAWYSDWFKILLQSIFSNPRRLTLHLAEAYLAGYVAFALFPFDILLSANELEQKLSGDSWGWLLAGDPQGRTLTFLKAISETILTVPFGLLFGYRSLRPSATYKQAACMGILLGSLIEIAQLFTATGVSQGFSILTRMAGTCGGLALWRHRKSWSPDRLTALSLRYALPLGMIYLAVLLQVNGWFSHRWNGGDLAISKLGDVHFLPFYYHYFTTEAKALFSLASVCLMYLPIGLLVWSRRGTPFLAFSCALVMAGLVEAGKLFLQGQHPDPTNILLAALASGGVVHLTRVLAEAAAMPSMARLTTSQDQLMESARPYQDKHSTIQTGPVRDRKTYALSLPPLAFAAYWAANFPTQAAFLCLILAACAAIIWHRPALLVAIILTALPILDLAPWSGRFFLDEFDLLLLTGLAIGYARVPPVPPGNRQTDTLFVLASCLLAVSFSISAMRGLFPWQSPDANAFTNYYSPFNALRIGKGALWAFLGYGLLRRLVAARLDVKRPLALGMVTGLAMTVAVIVWERSTFSSLFDFASDYRVTGPFSSMHTGGAYIECFLVVATPFLALLVLETRSWGGRLAGAFLLLATTYALMVTFSRNGYSAFALTMAIALFFAAFKSGRWKQRSIFVVALIGAMLAVSVPIFTGQFAQDRIATIGKDYAIRQAHWKDALDMRTPDMLTTVFGMGIGRYPESHYLLSSEKSHAGIFQLKKEGENTFLRLGSGAPIYVEQIVSIASRHDYVLKLKVRAANPDEKKSVSLCEKWMLTSSKCVRLALDSGTRTGNWNGVEVPFNTGSLGNSPWYASKPVKLALHNSPETSAIDIDDVRLESSSGENLLRNGDFSKELDHWFHSADSHLNWHAKSLPVAVLFDQGWLGLVALCAFSLLAMTRAANRAWRGELHAAAALAAYSGFLVVGLFDTLIDAPRFLLLLLLLGWYCGKANPMAIKEHGNG